MDWQDIVIKGSEYPVDENQDCNDENQNNVEGNQDSAEESCGICSKVFKNKESLRKHHQTHKIEPSTCDVCDKEFRSKQLLRKHRNTVHNDTIYQCKSCPKRFTGSRTLSLNYMVKCYTEVSYISIPTICDFVSKAQF